MTIADLQLYFEAKTDSTVIEPAMKFDQEFPAYLKWTAKMEENPEVADVRKQAMEYFATKIKPALDAAAAKQAAEQQ